MLKKRREKNTAKLNGLYENHLQKNHGTRKQHRFGVFLSVANVYGYADASFIAPDEKNRNIVIDAKICVFF
ncbi:MAG: hypothetical protein L6V79_03885 [Clostridium sp.]|nr:MAG: hypothetical protein L6V79_03885 [Clostridium sp.]